MSHLVIVGVRCSTVVVTAVILSVASCAWNGALLAQPADNSASSATALLVRAGDLIERSSSETTREILRTKLKKIASVENETEQIKQLNTFIVDLNQALQVKTNSGSPNGGQPDPANAVKEYRNAAEKGDADAQIRLGNCYYNGEGVTKDYGEAMKWYRKAAEQGNAAAQNSLGVLYEDGKVVAQNKSEAVMWYRKAAEQGDAAAQSNLGNCYYNGNGIAQDYGEAVRWYRKAADQGYVCSQTGLGLCFYLGLGVEKDQAEGVRWFRKAAEQGYADAQTNLAISLYRGVGVEKNQAEAVRWFRKAAEQGAPTAQGNLGACLAVGNGIAKDSTEAVKWFRKAAEQGNAEAQYQLATHLDDGDGVVRDTDEAAKWLSKAIERGHGYAREYQRRGLNDPNKRLYHRMTQLMAGLGESSRASSTVVMKDLAGFSTTGVTDQDLLKLRQILIDVFKLHTQMATPNETAREAFTAGANAGNVGDGILAGLLVGLGAAAKQQEIEDRLADAKPLNDRLEMRYRDR